jgi:cell wall-associated NlpC family hydrolase
MYAGGRVVPGLTTDRHVQADFVTTSFIYSSGLPHVPFTQLRRGDLIFYGADLSHMAIYLGNGRIVESVPPAVRIATVYADGLAPRPYVVRPFPS